jgi:peptidoglycan/LPS O-acetylase OafA/YrhL
VTERLIPNRNTKHTHIPALDGVRALAIAVVIAYHADLVFVPGGFLGVEMFFVLSGFLVSGGLIAELERRGRIRLGRYALRRLQRLGPALLAMLGVVALIVLLGFPDQLSHLRRGSFGALTGSGNWLELTNGDYFATFGRGPVLRHLWSFAVEVQAYVILPVLIGLLWALSGRDRTRLALFLGLLAGIGYVWQAIIAIRYPDSSRAYFGTDTRIAALLLGASVASLDRKRLRDEVPTLTLDILAGVSLLGLGSLVAVVEGTDPVLYRGILALTGLLSALLVFAAATAVDSFAGLVLGSALFRWIGTRSYGLYLWHWPIFVLTRPVAGVPLAPIPFALRVGATAVAAELCFRFIESRSARSVPRVAWSRRRCAELGIAALAGFLLFGVATATPARSDELSSEIPVVVVPPPPPTQAPSVIDVSTTTTTTTTRITTPSDVAVAPTVPASTVAPTTISATTVATTTIATTTTLPPLPPGLVGNDVTLIGDSVLRSAEPALRARLGLNVTIDSKVGRQFGAALDLVKTLRAEGRLKPIVVVALGTNGPIREADVDALVAELQDRKMVAFVQVEVPRRWKKSVNERFATAKVQYPAIVVIDWPTRVKTLKLRLPDGVHPAPKAAASYADLLIESLGTPTATL